jgi:hypothetical protein
MLDVDLQGEARGRGDGRDCCGRNLDEVSGSKPLTLLLSSAER